MSNSPIIKRHPGQRRVTRPSLSDRLCWSSATLSGLQASLWALHTSAHAAVRHGADCLDCAVEDGAVTCAIRNVEQALQAHFLLCSCGEQVRCAKVQVSSAEQKLCDTAREVGASAIVKRHPATGRYVEATELTGQDMRLALCATLQDMLTCIERYLRQVLCSDRKGGSNVVLSDMLPLLNSDRHCDIQSAMTLNLRATQCTLGLVLTTAERVLSASTMSADEGDKCTVGASLTQLLRDKVMYCMRPFSSARGPEQSILGNGSGNNESEVPCIRCDGTGCTHERQYALQHLLLLPWWLWLYDTCTSRCCRAACNVHPASRPTEHELSYVLSMLHDLLREFHARVILRSSASLILSGANYVLPRRQESAGQCTHYEPQPFYRTQQKSRVSPDAVTRSVSNVMKSNIVNTCAAPGLPAANDDMGELPGDSFAGHALPLPAVYNKDDAGAALSAMAAVLAMTTPSQEEQLMSTVTSGRLPLERSDPFLDLPSDSLSTRATLQSVPSLIVLPHSHRDGGSGPGNTATVTPYPSHDLTQRRAETTCSTEVNVLSFVQASCRSDVNRATRKVRSRSTSDSSQHMTTHVPIPMLHVDPTSSRSMVVVRQTSERSTCKGNAALSDDAEVTMTVLLHSTRLVLRLLQDVMNNLKGDSPTSPLQPSWHASTVQLGVEVLVASPLLIARSILPAVRLTPLLDALLEWLCGVDACAMKQVVADSATARFMYAWQLQFTRLTAALGESQSAVDRDRTISGMEEAINSQYVGETTLITALRWHVALLAGYLTRAVLTPAARALHDDDAQNAPDISTVDETQSASLLALMEQPILMLLHAMSEVDVMHSSSVRAEPDTAYESSKQAARPTAAQQTSVLCIMQVFDALFASILDVTAHLGVGAVPAHLLRSFQGYRISNHRLIAQGEEAREHDFMSSLSDALCDFCSDTLERAVSECMCKNSLHDDIAEAEDDLLGKARTWFCWPEFAYNTWHKLRSVFVHMRLVTHLRRYDALRRKALKVCERWHDDCAVRLALCTRLLRSSPFMQTRAVTAEGADALTRRTSEARWLCLCLRLLRSVQDDVTPLSACSQTRYTRLTLNVLLDKALYHESTIGEAKIVLDAASQAQGALLIFDAVMCVLRCLATGQGGQFDFQKCCGCDDERYTTPLTTLVAQLLRTLRALCAAVERAAACFFVSPHMAAALAHVLEAIRNTSSLPCQSAGDAMTLLHARVQPPCTVVEPAVESATSATREASNILSSKALVGERVSSTSTTAQSELSLPVNTSIVIPTLCLTNLGPPLYFLSAGDTGAAEAMQAASLVAVSQERNPIPGAAAATSFTIGTGSNTTNYIKKKDTSEATDAEHGQDGKKETTTTTTTTTSARFRSPCSNLSRSAASPPDTNDPSATAAALELGTAGAEEHTKERVGECTGYLMSASTASRSALRLPPQVPTRVSVELVLCLCTLVLQRGGGNIRYIFTESSMTTRTLPLAGVDCTEQHGKRGTSISSGGPLGLSAAVCQRLLAQVGRDTASAVAHPSCFHVLKSLVEYLHAPGAREVRSGLTRWLCDVFDDVIGCGCISTPHAQCRRRAGVPPLDGGCDTPNVTPCTALACGVYVLLRLLLPRPCWLQRFRPGKRLGAGGFAAAMAVTYSAATAHTTLSSDEQLEIDAAEDAVLCRTVSLAMKRMPFHLHGSDCGNLYFCHGEVLAMLKLARRATTPGDWSVGPSQHAQCRIATLLSFGCTGGEYFLIMPRYMGGSVLTWRLAHHALGCAALGTRFTVRVNGGQDDDGGNNRKPRARGAVVSHSYTLLGLCARIFRQALEAVVYLHECHIRHSDIKAANLFIDDCIQATVWNVCDDEEEKKMLNRVSSLVPRPYMLPCTVRLGDFGSCDGCEWDDLNDLLCDLLADDNGTTFLAGRWGSGRGTEAVQPPEVMYAPRRYRLMRDLVASTVGTATAQGATAGTMIAQLHTVLRRMELAVDVWGCGSLLYELLTGRMLFGEDRIMRLLALATSAAQGQPPTVLTTKELHELRATAGEGVVRFLCRLLDLDPMARPTATEALAQWSTLMTATNM